MAGFICGRCGTTYTSTIGCPNCKQIDAINKQTKVQEKQLKEMQRANKAAGGGSGGGSGGGMGDAFSTGYNSSGADVVIGLFRASVNALVIAFKILWQIVLVSFQLVKKTFEMINQFRTDNPVLFNKIIKYSLITIAVLVLTSVIINGIREFYLWANTYNYGVVGFWIVFAVLVGIFAVFVYFRKEVVNGFKEGYEKTSNSDTNADNNS